MENHTKKTREALLHDVAELKRNATQVAQDVRKHASAHVDDTKQRVTDTILTVKESIVGHPFSLLGIGFLFGFVLGWRFRR